MLHLVLLSSTIPAFQNKFFGTVSKISGLNIFQIITVTDGGYPHARFLGNAQRDKRFLRKLFIRMRIFLKFSKIVFSREYRDSLILNYVFSHADNPIGSG